MSLDALRAKIAGLAFAGIVSESGAEVVVPSVAVAILRLMNML